MPTGDALSAGRRNGRGDAWKGTVTDTFEASPGAFPIWNVVAELGRGADTVVYRVRLRGGEYTLKVLTTSRGQRALAAVRREAALLGSSATRCCPASSRSARPRPGPT